MNGVAAGFANETVGIDTSPFFSGDTISYKMQSALTNGTTYWWRARAIDPSGGNVWSVWSDLRSFTIDTSVLVSTWFQTTQSQFSNDTLSGCLIDDSLLINNSNCFYPTAIFSSSDSAFCEKSYCDFFDLSTNSPTSWLWSFPGGIPNSSSLQNPDSIFGKVRVLC